MPSKQLSDYYFKIYDAANEAAMEAVRSYARQKVEMYPQFADLNPFSDWFYPGECCGRASVRVKGNTSFGRWVKTHQGWRVFDPPGVCMDDHLFGQVYQRQVVFARAFVKALREAGIEAWSTDSLD